MMIGSFAKQTGWSTLAALSAAACALGLPQVALAQDKPASIEGDGTVVVPTFRLPPSAYTSEQAKAALPRKPTDPEAMMFQMLAAGKAGEMRKREPEFMAGQIRHLKQLYPVTTEDTTVAGIRAVVITPTAPIPAANRRKIMLDLPGGGFVMGEAGGTGLTESIPLAVLAKVKIVSITYRQAPEATFPAASEDVAAVYRTLLKDHRPEDIAIFGCSAGGMLTAESMAWFQKEHLPLPGAIGIFCASADARRVGDSQAYSRPFQAIPSREGPRNYFGDRDLTDPLISPIFSADYLRHFPPTLIISATRAMDVSSGINTHRELVKLGVDAELHLWDGLGHAFFYNIDLPESKEAFDVMALFFRKHLKLAQ
jgi:monoterpene epsilon-lactone hydrolase